MKYIKIRSLPQRNAKITTQQGDDSQSIPPSQNINPLAAPINLSLTLKMGTITAQTKGYKYTRGVTPLYVDANREKFIKGLDAIYGKDNYSWDRTSDMIFVRVNHPQPDDLETELQLRGFIPLAK